MVDEAKGKFEADPKILGKKAKDRKGEVQDVDLKEIIPDYLSSDKIPRGIRMGVNRAFDSYLESAGGLYAYTKGTKVQIFFDGASGNIAKNKIKTVSGKIRDILQSGSMNDLMSAASSGGSGSGGGAAGGQASAEKKKEEPSALARVMKEGLPENPDEKTLNVWAQRVLQDIVHQQEGQFLPKELLLLGNLYKPVFLPLWFHSREVMNGSFCQIIGAPQPRENGERHRQTFAVLVAAIIAALRFLKKGGQGIIIVPVFAPLFQNNDLTDLYLAILRSLPTSLRQTIAIEIRGLPDPPVSEVNREKIMALSKHCRAVCIHTSILSPLDYSFQAFKPFAYILNCSGYGAGVLGTTLKKSAAFCAGKGVKSIATGIKDEHELSAAAAGGVDFISGPYLGTSREAYAVQPFTKAQIGKPPATTA
ncbi:MAG TPA: hypothetical protein VIF12_08495 [Micavibrio sp.]|jgi:hypothetical protein